MKSNITAIPQGTRTYLFEEAELKRRLEQELYVRLKERGFQEIATPLLEYHDSAVVGLSDDERNRIIRFTEEDSGRAIALRADITSQIARSVATHLAGRPLPLKLCYSGPVFRRTQKGKGEQYVLNQGGMEIVGAVGPETDVEIIGCVAAILGAVGINGCALSLGHAGIIGSFMKGVPPQYGDKIRAALAKKDKSALSKLLRESSCGPEISGKIVALAGMFGGKEVLQDAENICAGNEPAAAALKNLAVIFDAAERSSLGKRLTLDLGEIRGFGYYTGVMMELFSLSGLALGAGGRYDSLVGRFGKDLPAVGFAFDIDRMIEAVMREYTGAALETLLAKLGK